MKKWYDKISEERFSEMHAELCSSKKKSGKLVTYNRRRKCGRFLYKKLKRDNLPFGLRWDDYFEYKKRGKNG